MTTAVESLPIDFRAARKVFNVEEVLQIRWNRSAMDVVNGLFICKPCNAMKYVLNSRILKAKKEQSMWRYGKLQAVMQTSQLFINKELRV